jgi:quercetin dioxygenase-like cupin family protein
MRGSITCILDNDEHVTLHAGDVIVQRGTIHGWQNETDEWTRVYFVMLRALLFYRPSVCKQTGDDRLLAV